MIKGIDESDFRKWRVAYAECKKQGSWVFSDQFDDFIKKLSDGYKKTIGSGTSCRYENILIFLKDVIGWCDQYLSKEAYFYKDNRKKVVEDLLRESVKLIGNLKVKLAKYLKERESEKKALFGWLKSSFGGNVNDSSLVVTRNSINCLRSIVFDIDYTGTGYTSLRFYLIIRSYGGLIENFNKEKFNFKSYKLNDKPYEDKYFNSREIYKIFGAPIKIDIPKIGNVMIEGYASPNDWLAEKAAGRVQLDKDGVYFGKSLI